MNKLTPDNFEKMLNLLLEAGIDSAAGLNGLIAQLFEKSLTEVGFCPLYAGLCRQLLEKMPEFEHDGQTYTFRRVLLNKCQEEFEKGEACVREAEEAVVPEYEEIENAGEEEGEVRRRKLTALEIRRKAEEREDGIRKAKRRMLGNIRFIGELFKQHILTEKIMHECIKKLLQTKPGNEDPNLEDMEALCNLMTTIGKQIDHEKSIPLMEMYFQRIGVLSVCDKLPSRIRFMLKDVIELRDNNWVTRRKTEGPKKIEDVHKDAKMEQFERARVGAGSRGGPRDGRRDFGRGGGMMGGGQPMGGRGMGGPGGGFPGPMNGHGNGAPPPGLGAPRPGANIFPPNRDGGGANMRGGAGPNLRPTGSRPVIKLAEKGASGTATSSGGTNAASESAPSTPRESTAEKLEALQRKCRRIAEEFYSVNDMKELELSVRELNIKADGAEMIASWFRDAFGRRGAGHWEKLGVMLVHLCGPDRDAAIQLPPAAVGAGLRRVFDDFEDLLEDNPKGKEFVGDILASLILSCPKYVALKDLDGYLRKPDESDPDYRPLVEAGAAEATLASTLRSLKDKVGESALLPLWEASGLDLLNFLDRPEEEEKKRCVQKYDLQCLFPALELTDKLETFLQGDGGPQPGKALEWCRENLSKNALKSDTCAATCMRIALHALFPTADALRDYKADDLQKLIPGVDDPADRNTMAYFLKHTVGRSPISAQVKATYEVQRFCHSLGHVKLFMCGLFFSLYEVEALTEASLLKWKDDINESIPGKMEAILDTNKFFAWLATAESDDDEDDD